MPRRMNTTRLFGHDRIDQRPDLRHLVGGEAALAGMLSNQGFTRRDIYAIDLVVGDEAFDPLNRRSEIAQYVARLGRDPLKVSGRQFSRAWNLTFDNVLRHGRLLGQVAMKFAPGRNHCGPELVRFEVRSSRPGAQRVAEASRTAGASGEAEA